MLKLLVERLKLHEKRIEEWFTFFEGTVREDPVYASVDLRNAGFKIAPVDTNIFPGGFNNLCPSFRREAMRLFKEYFGDFFTAAKKVVILTEEHTRNLFYFENLFVLRGILVEVGLEVELATLSPELTEDHIIFETSEKNSVRLWKMHLLKDGLTIKPWRPDLILINNDFSGGIPKELENSLQPLIPTPLIGWHSRRKSDHFSHYANLANQFAELIDIDPWLIKAHFTSLDGVDFSDEKSMEILGAKVDDVLAAVAPKYREHGVTEVPYVFVKHNSGTYGMGVMTAHSGDELIHLNKKQRAHMKMGRSKRPISDVIIQEGLPTVDRLQGSVAEPVIYLVKNNVAGGFFRLHPTVDDRGNLNQPGMHFSKLCFHELTGYANEYKGECDLECLAMIYKTIARIASLAAGCEIKHTKHHTT